jgi:hypothetical protein
MCSSKMNCPILKARLYVIGVNKGFQNKIPPKRANLFIVFEKYEIRTPKRMLRPGVGIVEMNVPIANPKAIECGVCFIFMISSK